MRNGIAVLTRYIQPQIDRFLGPRNRRRRGSSMGHASRQLGYVRYKDAIFCAPGNNEVILVGLQDFPRARSVSQSASTSPYGQFINDGRKTAPQETYCFPTRSARYAHYYVL